MKNILQRMWAHKEALDAYLNGAKMNCKDKGRRWRWQEALTSPWLPLPWNTASFNIFFSSRSPRLNSTLHGPVTRLTCGYSFLRCCPYRFLVTTIVNACMWFSSDLILTTLPPSLLQRLAEAAALSDFFFFFFVCVWCGPSSDVEVA